MKAKQFSGFLQVEGFHGLPGASPASHVFRLVPDNADFSSTLVQLRTHVRRNIATKALRHAYRLTRYFDAKRGTKTVSVDFPVSLRKSLGEVLAQVFDDGER